MSNVKPFYVVQYIPVIKRNGPIQGQIFMRTHEKSRVVCRPSREMYAKTSFEIDQKENYEKLYVVDYKNSNLHMKCAIFQIKSGEKYF